VGKRKVLRVFIVYWCQCYIGSVDRIDHQRIVGAIAVATWPNGFSPSSLIFLARIVAA
jgi:hypothetical protein